MIVNPTSPGFGQSVRDLVKDRVQHLGGRFWCPKADRILTTFAQLKSSRAKNIWTRVRRMQGVVDYPRKAACMRPRRTDDRLTATRACPSLRSHSSDRRLSDFSSSGVILTRRPAAPFRKVFKFNRLLLSADGRHPPHPRYCPLVFIVHMQSISCICNRCRIKRAPQRPAARGKRGDENHE
jgi:hypothetical protein